MSLEASLLWVVLGFGVAGGGGGGRGWIDSRGAGADIEEGGCSVLEGADLLRVFLLFGGEFGKCLPHPVELVEQMVVVFGNFVQEKFLGADDGS
jgi:hypothetical protein